MSVYQIHVLLQGSRGSWDSSNMCSSLPSTISNCYPRLDRLRQVKARNPRLELCSFSFMMDHFVSGLCHGHITTSIYPALRVSPQDEHRLELSARFQQLLFEERLLHPTSLWPSPGKIFGMMIGILVVRTLWYCCVSSHHFWRASFWPLAVCFYCLGWHVASAHQWSLMLLTNQWHPNSNKDIKPSS